MSLNTSTGLISGTVAAGTSFGSPFGFQVIGYNADGDYTLSSSIAVTVSASAPVGGNGQCGLSLSLGLHL